MARQPDYEAEPSVNLATRIPVSLHRALRIDAERRQETIKEYAIRALEERIRRAVKK